MTAQNRYTVGWLDAQRTSQFIVSQHVHFFPIHDGHQGCPNRLKVSRDISDLPSFIILYVTRHVMHARLTADMSQ